eukprot:5408526-Lingulodinium_polyedra.AAC.1
MAALLAILARAAIPEALGLVLPGHWPGLSEPQAVLQQPRPGRFAQDALCQRAKGGRGQCRAGPAT